MALGYAVHGGRRVDKMRTPVVAGDELGQGLHLLHKYGDEVSAQRLGCAAGEPSLGGSGIGGRRRDDNEEGEQPCEVGFEGGSHGFCTYQILSSLLNPAFRSCVMFPKSAPCYVSASPPSPMPDYSFL